MVGDNGSAAFRRYLSRWLGPAKSSFELAQEYVAGTEQGMSVHLNVPGRGNTSVVSSGLCDLQLIHEDELLDQELIFSQRSEQVTERLLEDIANVIAAVCADDHRQRLRQGEVRKITRPLASAVGPTHLMADLPQYLPEVARSMEVGDRRMTLVWLVPLFSSEADFLTSEGYDRLGELFEREDPDLLDLSRPAVV